MRHPNGWWRSTAQRLLVEHFISRELPGKIHPTAAPLLIDALKDKTDPLTRLHALWSLAAVWSLAGSDSMNREVLSDVARDPSPALREHALRVAAVLEQRLRQRLLSTSTLVELADDPAVRVRLHAAIALGNRCREEPAALDALAKIAAKDADDPWMRLAILSGLAESSLAFLPLCDAIPSAAAGRNCNPRPPRSSASADKRPSWSRC